MGTEEQWDDYLESVRRYLGTGKLDADEIDYKLEIGRKLEAARRRSWPMTTGGSISSSRRCPGKATQWTGEMPTI